jgi:hypothetical protein
MSPRSNQLADPAPFLFRALSNTVLHERAILDRLALGFVVLALEPCFLAFSLLPRFFLN